MLKRIAILGMIFGIVFACTACASSQNQSSGDKDMLEKEDIVSAKNPNSKSTSGSDSEKQTNADSSILIAYFSWSGNTKKLAGMIQEQTGGNLFEIKPKTEYTNDIDELSGIALQEQSDDIRPELSTHVENMDEYKVVFIGFPNWWNNMPMPVFTFLEEYDFSGKTVVPFTTHGNGGFGRSMNSIKEILTNSTILDGLAVQENELEDASVQVEEWIQKLDVVR